MRCVRTALFLVLYRVIPSCHSWGFSPIAPSWGCPKGLKTKIWPELQLFCDYGLSQGVKTQIADQNRSKSVVEQSPFRFADRGKESAIAKKLQESRDFCFHNEELCGHVTKKWIIWVECKIFRFT